MLMRLRLVALTYPKSTRHDNLWNCRNIFTQLANLLFDIQERRKNDNLIDCRAQTLYSHTVIILNDRDEENGCILMMHFMQSEKLEFS